MLTTKLTPPANNKDVASLTILPNITHVNASKTLRSSDGLSVFWRRIKGSPLSLRPMSFLLFPFAFLLFFDGKDEIKLRFRSSTCFKAE
jgi:hypothetical protein